MKAAVVVDACEHLLQQQRQALHLLTQRTDTAVIKVENQPCLFALQLQARRKAAGQDVLKAHEALQRLTHITAGQQQVTDHIHRPWLHGFAQVQANISITTDTFQRLPEARGVVVVLAGIEQRRCQQHALVSLAIGVRRVEP